MHNKIGQAALTALDGSARPTALARLGVSTGRTDSPAEAPDEDGFASAPKTSQRAERVRFFFVERAECNVNLWHDQHCVSVYMYVCLHTCECGCKCVGENGLHVVGMVGIANVPCCSAALRGFECFLAGLDSDSDGNAGPDRFRPADGVRPLLALLVDAVRIFLRAAGGWEILWHI